MNMRISVLIVFLLASMLFCSIFAGVRPVHADFDLSNVAYYQRVKSVLGFSGAQEDMLRQYGFVTVAIPNITRFENFYGDLVWQHDLPVIVTTDSFLQLFHVVFDCSLRTLEKEAFYPMLLNLTSYAFNASLADYAVIAHDGSQKQWTIGNATVYFAVALSLLTNTTASVPLELSGDVAFYLSNIWSSNLQFVSAAEWEPARIRVEYDFTQFTVRGHYVGDPQLENYFRGMMWYGQFPAFIPRLNESYVWDCPHIDDSAIVYMRDIMRQNHVRFGEWELLYNVTNALVGKSDSINFLSLETALHRVFGDQEKYLDSVLQPNGTAALREELEKDEYAQRILSQGLVQPEPGLVLQAYPLVFQFVGQRYVPDSYIFQHLCWDKVGYNSTGGRRILPKGLDIFAVLGSQRASQLLTPDFGYDGFEANLSSLQNEFNGLTEENWTYSSYTSWIHALQALVDINYTNDYPDFMKSLAWQDEKLNTALGSWAQLRHDTILYAKQTYIPVYVCSYPEAFLEPNPTFYSRMQNLVNQTLEAVNILKPEMINTVVLSSLNTLINASGRFVTISNKELAREALTQDETSFLKSLVQTWGGCGGTNYDGWYVNLLMCITGAGGLSPFNETNVYTYTADLDSRLVADVATFPPGDMDYPPQILHIGTGEVNALVALLPLPNGTLVTGVGPVFSYYEFPLIGTKRLNDEEWRGMLNWDNITAYLPEQLKDVHALAMPMLPEYPNTVLLIAVMVIALVVVAAKRIDRTKTDATRKTRLRT
jgi:hypothetical protein